MLLSDLLDLSILNTAAKVMYLLLRVLLIPLLLILLASIAGRNTGIANILHDLEINVINQLRLLHLQLLCLQLLDGLGNTLCRDLLLVVLVVEVQQRKDLLLVRSLLLLWEVYWVGVLRRFRDLVLFGWQLGTVGCWRVAEGCCDCWVYDWLLWGACAVLGADGQSFLICCKFGLLLLCSLWWRQFFLCCTLPRVRSFSWPIGLTHLFWYLLFHVRLWPWRSLTREPFLKHIIFDHKLFLSFKQLWQVKVILLGAVK